MTIEACDPSSIIELFERQVKIVGSASALLSSEGKLTFRELDQNVNQMAHWLLAQGMKRGSIIGVCLYPSQALIVSLLAILKIGGVYLPLDPDYPSDRHKYLISDCAASLVICTSGMFREVDIVETRYVSLDVHATSASRMPRHSPNVNLQPDDLAYIIYTSGSTGNPKGVMAPHRSAVNRILAQPMIQRLEANEIWLQKTSIGFVDSIFEILCALCLGVRHV